MHYLLSVYYDYCFEHLFAHHQEVLYIQLVHFVRNMSAGWNSNPSSSQLT
jgi:hypothetical protein